MRDYFSHPKCKAPACCNLSCCGNSFGKTNSHKPHGRPNRKKLSRRYFRHANKFNYMKEMVNYGYDLA